jgi:hypothetical protein
MNLPGAPHKYDRDTLQAILNEIRREDARNGKQVAGIWSPTLGDGTNAYTLSTASGLYVKLGLLVLVTVDVAWTSIGSAGAGQLRLGGLPFLVANISGNRPGFSFADCSGLDATAAENTIIASGSPDSSAIFFRRVADNAASVALAANSSSGTGAISGSMVYQA